MNRTLSFLSTLGAEHHDRRIALVVVLLSLAVFLGAAPFAKVPLPPVPAFVPIYKSALVICEVITAVLLIGQYRILRAPALLVLAAGYLFSAAMAVAHALSFPGLFAPGGLLGAGPQTTAWLYFFMHGGFPLFVVGYTLLKQRDWNQNRDWDRAGEAASARSGLPMVVAVTVAVAAVLALVLSLTLLATAGNDALPAIMAGPAKMMVATITWMLSLGALALLWWRRPHSLLDLWLMVVLCIWIFDTALAAVLNHARYDVGWYAGRIYGLLAASFVLMVLLLENGKLYARLADAHQRERGKSADLEQLTGQLEAANALLAERNQQLAEASRLKSEFLANMSHELRTPLNAIIGFSEVLKDGLLGEITPEQREYVTDIFDSGQHLLSLINDILDLSKVEAGKMTLDLAPLDVDVMLRNSLSIIKEKAATHRIQLQFDATTILGTALLDARKTKQIAFNLLSNGVKFTPEGGRVTLLARKVARAGIEVPTDATEIAVTSLRMPLAPSAFEEFLEISVEDTGIGISATDAPRLFQAFSQLDASLSREAEGTGLGLALVYRLAQLHGGTVALSSTPGHGSRFTVWLPWRDATPDSDGDHAKWPPRSGVAGPARPVALVIEDNAHAAELIRLQLEPEGFEILHAADAHAGLDLLAQREPSVIILDIMLRDMDGWELLARIKQPGSASAHIPVVIASIVADTQQGISIGASAVLQKPVGREELITALVDLGLTPGNRALKVLVVDDDPKAVELLSAYLAEPGYTVLRAHDGREGIATARQEHPDLIVLDLMMPEVNGFDVIEVLKHSPDTATIPIVIVTAKTLTAEERAVLNHSVAAVMEKASFNDGHFASEVRRVLALARST